MNNNLNSSSDITFIDLHAHPSLKTYLFNKRLYKKHKTGGAWNPLAMRVDLPKIVEGGVNAIFSSVYLPENKMIMDCTILSFITSLVGLFSKKFRSVKKGNPFSVTMDIIDNFEQAVAKAQKKGWNNFEIARSVSDFKRILSENKIAFIHSIEGAHSLDGKLENLQKFFDRGVSMLTLAHFYENEVTRTVGGIPQSKKMLWCFKNEKEQSEGLPTLGRQVVEEMIRIGMLIDLSHCTIKARDEIYKINNKRRPLVFSHNGVHKMNPAAMNPTDEEIKLIADCGGVIGVIFMNFWLFHKDKKNGLELIINTIRHLKKIGGIDCIAIGSDFDGFTDPPDDIKDMSKMPKLTKALFDAGFSDEEVEKILGKNVLRVIEEGWGKV